MAALTDCLTTTMYNLLIARIYDILSEPMHTVSMKSKTKSTETNVFLLILPRFPYHDMQGFSARGLVPVN